MRADALGASISLGEWASRAKCVDEEDKAAKTISRFAADEGADLVVLSRFGRGGVTDFGPGSVALKVVATCPVCVLLVGPSDEGQSVREAI